MHSSALREKLTVLFFSNEANYFLYEVTGTVNADAGYEN
jgi:hypothetical protein